MTVGHSFIDASSTSHRLRPTLLGWLSPEKALQKLRKSDAQKLKNARLDEENSELDEEIKRMREQRLRLERRQKKRD